MSAMGRARASLFALAAIAAMCASLSHAGDSGMQIRDAWARRAPMLEGADSKSGSGNGAVYATLVNRGETSDALIAASSDSARAVEIHQSYQESGMMMMRSIDRIDVPAGASIEMKPGGYHFMLLDLKRALEPGQVVKLMVSFRDAGQVPVTAQVR